MTHFIGDQLASSRNYMSPTAGAAACRSRLRSRRRVFGAMSTVVATAANGNPRTAALAAEHCGVRTRHHPGDRVSPPRRLGDHCSQSDGTV